jgi:hypothetical protein
MNFRTVVFFLSIQILKCEGFTGSQSSGSHLLYIYYGQIVYREHEFAIFRPQFLSIMEIIYKYDFFELSFFFFVKTAKSKKCIGRQFEKIILVDYLHYG